MAGLITDEARSLIQIRDLLQVPALSHELKRWLRLGRLLGFVDSCDRVVLVALQGYLSQHNAGQRCPCQRLGRSLLEADDHWDCCQVRQEIMENDAAWKEDAAKAEAYALSEVFIHSLSTVNKIQSI